MAWTSPVSYAVRPGVSADPAVDDAARLLVEAEVPSGARLLIMEAGCGALLAAHAGRF